MDADDHSVISKTYPKHPISDNVPNYKTRTELLEQRKKKEQVDIKQKMNERNELIKKLQTGL